MSSLLVQSDGIRYLAFLEAMKVLGWKIGTNLQERSAGKAKFDSSKTTLHDALSAYLGKRVFLNRLLR